jgi:hypothetical protein
MPTHNAILFTKVNKIFLVEIRMTFHLKNRWFNSSFANYFCHLLAIEIG